MAKKKRRTAQPDPYQAQRGSLPYGKLSSIINAELYRLQSPVAHIDPATIDLADLIQRAKANR